MPRSSAYGESSGWSLIDEHRIPICCQKESRLATTQVGLVKWLAETHRNKVTHVNVSNTLKRSNELLYLDDTSDNLTVKRHRFVAFPLLEAALYQWITECENQVNMSRDIIKEKTTEFFPLLYPDALQSIFRMVGSKSSIKICFAYCKIRSGHLVDGEDTNLDVDPPAEVIEELR